VEKQGRDWVGRASKRVRPCVTESVRNRMMGKGLRRLRRVQKRAHKLLADRESIDAGLKECPSDKWATCGSGDSNGEVTEYPEGEQLASRTMENGSRGSNLMSIII